MEIFGIGLPEMLLIGVVLVIVMGPDRLPEAARSIGKAVADFRRAIEPARSAWADVSRELTSSLDMTPAGTNTPGTPGGNPWQEHPVAEGLSPEEKAEFFRTGEIPAWRRLELDALDAERKNGGNGTAALAGEPMELDYPMPHSKLSYQPAPPFGQEPEELSYPEPSGSPKAEATD